MHEDLGPRAGEEPDPAERSYRIDVILEGVPEVAGLAVMQRIADVLVEEGLGTPEGGDVRSVIGMHEHRDIPELRDALHLVIPKAIPRSPDLGANYSPN